jgi:hypothetical protein
VVKAMFLTHYALFSRRLNIKSLRASKAGNLIFLEQGRPPSKEASVR